MKQRRDIIIRDAIFHHIKGQSDVDREKTELISLLRKRLEQEESINKIQESTIKTLQETNNLLRERIKEFENKPLERVKKSFFNWFW